MSRIEGDMVRSLADLWSDYHNNRLLIPSFQRSGNYWPEAKKVSYLHAIINSAGADQPRPVGAFFTYSLKNDTAVYLSDGIQRISAIRDAYDNPQAYQDKHGMDLNVLKDAVTDHQVTVQHRVYATHFDASRAFEMLNQGTGLDPVSSYRPRLTTTPAGLLIDTEWWLMMWEAMKRAGVVERTVKETDSKFRRWANCWLLAYVRQGPLDKMPTLLDATLTQSGQPHVSEDDLAGWFREQDLRSVRDELAKACYAIHAGIETICQVRNEVFGQEVAFKRSALQHFLFENLYRITNKRTVSSWKEVMQKELEMSHQSVQGRTRQYISSSIDITPGTMNDGLKHNMTLRAAKLTDSTGRVCAYFNLEFFNGPPPRKTVVGPEGQHSGHIEPHSQGGTEVVLEPALDNLARGAKPMNRKTTINHREKQ